MIWRPWDNRKIAGTGTVCHCVVNVPAVMCSQIIPYEYTMEISARNIVRLNIRAHVVTEITEYVGGGTNVAYTPDPASRTFNTPSNMWRQCRIPRLDCKDDSNLRPMMVMPVLSDSLYLHSPPPCVGAFLQRHPKLVNVNLHSSRHLEYIKRKRKVPKTPNTKLNVRLLRLVAFGGRPFLCDLHLIKTS